VTPVNTLDFYCDWGSAEEYMSIMIKMVERAPAKDFVVARGVCLYARDFVKSLFARYGLNYKDHIRERDLPFESQEKPYTVILEKLRKYLDLTPVISIDEVCKTILSNQYRI
jgi:GDPmannose 4,6-dehydratase